jgi:hypothetical protein
MRCNDAVLEEHAAGAAAKHGHFSLVEPFIVDVHFGLDPCVYQVRAGWDPPVRAGYFSRSDGDVYF